jgi:hypothetical protein
MKINIMQLWRMYQVKKDMESLAKEQGFGGNPSGANPYSGNPLGGGWVYAPYVPVHVSKPVHIVGSGYITYAGTTTSLAGGNIKVVGTSTAFPGLKASIVMSDEMMKDMGVGAEEILAEEISKEMSREMDKKIMQTLAQLAASQKKI